MKWIELLSISAAVYASAVAAQCQDQLGGPCGDSSRPRDQNCCQVGYCQPWNSGYYQCIATPAQCPTQETDIDFAGNDIKTVYGLQPNKCCDECAKTANCKAYTFVNQNPDGKTACYLKTSADGRVEKKGAVSAVVVPVTPPPPPPNCPKQDMDVDYYGNDLKNMNGVTQTECCDACGNTEGCVGYSYVTSSKTCYLKSSTAGKVAKAGVISGEAGTTKPPPPPPKCPTQEFDVDYYGNDLKTVNGVTRTECCDACSNTDKCVAYSYVGSTKSCYLKSSAAGKVAKAGVISGQLLTTPPPPPPPNCPTQEVNVDYYGNDLKTINGGTQAECCDTCGSTDKCVAYSYVPSTKSCYLKSSTAGKVTKVGVISGQIKVTPPPPPPNCPTQEVNVDYFGNDLKTVNGVTQTTCCDACGTTDKCVAYTYVPSTKACYLKSSTAGKVAKDGVISGQINNTPPPPPPNCPFQEMNVDYYGNDVQTINGATQAECCDACHKVSECTVYSYVPNTKTCYLKRSTAGRVNKWGVISGRAKNVPPPPHCPTQEWGVDYVDNDIKTVKGVTNTGCCDACGATSGCRAYVYVEQNPDGKSACYLKSAAGKKVSKDGAVAGLYDCPTPVLGSCGSSATGPLCCPYGAYCQPWNSGYYQCLPAPDTAKCPSVVTGVDFYGGDIEAKFGLMPSDCCDACFNNKDCVVFTFVNQNPDGKSACYLKNKLVEQRPKAGAVSGYKIKAP